MKQRGQLPLTALRAFEVAGRHRSLKQACAELNLTAGAISQQVRALEDRLGVPLFDRARRHYEPTVIGAQLLSRLTHCFDDMENAVREVISQAEPRKLRLRLDPTFAARWLAPRLANFFACNLALDLEVRTVTGSAEISFDQCDFHVRYGKAPWHDVDHILLFLDDRAPVCSPALARTLRCPEDLHKHTLLHSSLRPQYWSEWLTLAGVDASIASHGPVFPDALIACEAAANGSGVAVMQRVYVEPDIARGRLVMPFAQHLATGHGYYMVNQTHRRGERKIREFAEWVGSVVALSGDPE
jgi:LysR family transcriptional regulator, glycine cleavage system transcriptional activator